MSIVLPKQKLRKAPTVRNGYLTNKQEKALAVLNAIDKRLSEQNMK